MKLREQVFEARLKREVMISEQHYGFFLRQSTTNVTFALRVNGEAQRKSGQASLCLCGSEKANDWLLRQGLLYYEEVRNGGEVLEGGPGNV